MIRKYRRPLALCLKATSLAVSLSSGYGRVFAGTCSGSGGSYLCSDAANPSTDTTVSINSTLPLTVTTSSGFGIDTTSRHGDAFNLTSTGGGLTFTDSYMSMITAFEDGIVAINDGNGDLTLTTTGLVTGTNNAGVGIGIWADNRAAGHDLTIAAADVLGGDDGINANNSGDGHLWITSTGSIEGTSDTGISASNSAHGTDLAITTANVTGGNHGIVATNLGTASLSITATDTVTGTNGMGIWSNNAGTNLTITAANVTGGDTGIRATNSGTGRLSITASGSVAGTNGMGIYANNSLNGTDLAITAANVTGDYIGIAGLNSGSGILSITASGNVIGATGYGVYAANSSSGSDLVISATNVTGGYVGIAGLNSGSGILSITASGNVIGTNGYGIYAANSFSGSDLIISTANVTGGYVGIAGLNSGSGIFSITASGNVIGTNGYGIHAANSSSGSDLIISTTNVTGEELGIYARNDGRGALVITSSGTVTGTNGDGIFIMNDGGQPANINICAQSLVQGGDVGIEVASFTGQSAIIDVYGQVGTLSGLTTSNAIVASGGPAWVNLFVGSITTGSVSLSNFSDTVTLAGTLNGSVMLGDGNDTFIQVGGSSLSGTADGGAGNDILGFVNMGTVNGSAYRNFENIGIYGGNTTLTGNWDLSTGTTTIYQGNLSADGMLSTSLLTVNSGATLSGNGVINGNMMIYGTVSPGHSIGTQTVQGDVTFASGSIYATELAADGNADLLQVTGQVAIDAGGQLIATLEPGLYANGRKWQIMTATDGINGSFSSVAIDLSSAVFSLQQVNQGDSLELLLARTPYADFGRTSNQRAVGEALDTILPTAHGSMAELLTAMDFTMAPAQITATLAGLNPEMYTAFAPSGLEMAGAFNRRVALRQQEIASYVSVPTDTPEQYLWSVWGQGVGNWLDRNTENGVAGYTLQTGGVVFGMDRQFGPRVRAGVAAGYDNGNLSWDDSANDGQIDGVSIGIYGGILLDGFYFDGSVGYTSIDNNADRRIVTPTATTRATSDFTSGAWEASVSGGYDFVLGSVRLGPVVAVNYQHLNQDGFSERGGGRLCRTDK